MCMCMYIHLCIYLCLFSTEEITEMCESGADEYLQQRELEL